MRSLLPLLALVSLAACGPPTEERVGYYGRDGSARYRGLVAHLESGVDVATGRWMFWYPNGQLQMRGAYAEGALVGPDDEQRGSTEVPRVGRHGEWTAWSPAGEQLWEGQYQNGLRTGVWTWWFTNGRERARGSFHDGLEQGHHQSWHIDGKQHVDGSFERGRKVGVHRRWDGSGRLREEGRFEDGLAVGAHTVWDENSILREEVFYVAGELNGTRSLWDANGRLFWVGQYARDVQDGEHSLYHTNGRLRQRGLYVSGKQQGVHVAWDDEGQKLWEFEFVGGVPNGKRTSWYENGRKRAEGTWSEGLVIPANSWPRGTSEAAAELETGVTGTRAGSSTGNAAGTSSCRRGADLRGCGTRILGFRYPDRGVSAPGSRKTRPASTRRVIGDEKGPREFVALAMGGVEQGEARVSKGENDAWHLEDRSVGSGALGVLQFAGDPLEYCCPRRRGSAGHGDARTDR